MKFRWRDVLDGCIKRLSLPLMGVVLILICTGGGVLAAGLSQGYSSSQQLPAGTLVAAAPQQANSVEAANSEINDNILGVVVTKSTVSVSDKQSKVQVTTSGSASVLVSDINGVIKKGDKITASPIDGVGMKATDSVKIVGTAQEDLSVRSTYAGPKTITDKEGASKQVLVGLIQIDVDVSYYQVPANQAKYVPAFIRDLSNYIGGKPVSTARMLSALVIIFASLICVVTFIYGAVRSGISSIGRNPLAKPAIQHSITKVIILAVAILAATGAIVYIVLRG